MPTPPSETANSLIERMPPSKSKVAKSRMQEIRGAEKQIEEYRKEVENVRCIFDSLPQMRFSEEARVAAKHQEKQSRVISKALTDVQVSWRELNMKFLLSESAMTRR